MNASKLPSGHWRVNLYLGKKDGKYKYKSITGKTKREAEQKAAAYLAENHLDDTPMTVGEACDKYIASASAVLSPSTLRTYKIIARKHIDGVSSFMADRVTNDDIQAWINDLSRRYAAKTVKNAYGLVRSSIASVRPAFVFNVKLPQKDDDIILIPSNDEVRQMIEAADPKLAKCIYLAAFGSLRRGEVCFLRYKDIKDGVVSVHGDVVMDDNDKWIEKKHAKTSLSNRKVRVPDFVIDVIGTGEPEDHVLNENPKWITDHFGSLMDKLDMPYHFHLLRHYFASTLIAQGVPKAYIQALGGWENGGSLDRVYTHVLQTARNDYSKQVSDYFSSEFREVNVK